MKEKRYDDNNYFHTITQVESNFWQNSMIWGQHFIHMTIASNDTYKYTLKNAQTHKHIMQIDTHSTHSPSLKRENSMRIKIQKELGQTDQNWLQDSTKGKYKRTEKKYKGGNNEEKQRSNQRRQQHATATFHVHRWHDMQANIIWTSFKATASSNERPMVTAGPRSWNNFDNEKCKWKSRHART